MYNKDTNDTTRTRKLATSPWFQSYGSEIHQIFDKFYRGRSAEKRKKNGIGLGLSYVKIMMEQLGGSISVTSKERAYTEFILIHPI